MSELNANPVFYWTLAEIRLNPGFNLFSLEQQQFVRNLMRDFEREGSHLQPDNQQRKKEIQLRIQQLESEFLYNVKHSRTLVKFHYDELESVPTDLRPARKGEIYEQTIESVLTLQEITELLGNSKLESVRKRSFFALFTSCPKNEAILNELLQNKSELAHVLGYPNYTEFLMKHQMFPQASKAAISILSQCYPNIEKKLSNEFGILQDRKARAEQEDRNQPISFQPWDVLYYSKQFLAALRSNSVPKIAQKLAAAKYFSLKNVMKGMQILLSETFGLEMTIKICPNSENWSNDILKAEIASNGSLLGVLYFDLFKRPFKRMLSASKLNIRCSKQKSVASSRLQTPIAILVCNYEKPVGSTLNTGLEDVWKAELHYEEVKELFHEFGHAIHAISSKTEFHCFSGTRVALDFAEFPSNLFELFLTDFDYVKLWALNSESYQEIPLALFRSLVATKFVFRGIEHQSLLLKALFDLKFHSQSEHSATEINASVQSEYPNQLYMASNQALPWFSSFEHLAEYGGSYYTYVLGQVLAELVWTKVFKSAVLNKSSGRKLMRIVLQSGEKVGSEMLGELLQAEQVTGEAELTYAFHCDVWQEVFKWYQNFARDDEMVSLEALRQADTWREVGGQLPHSR